MTDRRETQIERRCLALRDMYHHHGDKSETLARGERLVVCARSCVCMFLRRREEGRGGRRAEAHPSFSQTGSHAESCSGHFPPLSPGPERNGQAQIREWSTGGQTAPALPSLASSPFSGPSPVSSCGPAHIPPQGRLHLSIFLCPGCSDAGGAHCTSAETTQNDGAWGGSSWALPQAPRACSSDLS